MHVRRCFAYILGFFFVCLVFVVLLIVTAEVTGRPYLAACMYVYILGSSNHSTIKGPSAGHIYTYMYIRTFEIC